MRYIVLSDTHGNKKGINMLFSSITHDGVIFAGDGLSDFEGISEKEEFIKVRGNCDFFDKTENLLIFNINNTKVLLTHGHMENVKYGLNRLVKIAKENNANLVIYGHNHRQNMEKIDGITFLNPGSFKRNVMGKSCYAIVDFNDDGFLINMAQF